MLMLKMLGSLHLPGLAFSQILMQEGRACQEAHGHCFPTCPPHPAPPHAACGRTRKGSTDTDHTVDIGTAWAEAGDESLGGRSPAVFPSTQRAPTQPGLSHSTWHQSPWAGGRARGKGCLPHLCGYFQTEVHHHLLHSA